MEFAKEQKAVWLQVLLETGISRSELLGLKWTGFDNENCLLNIRQGTAEYKNPETGDWTLETDGLKNSYQQRAIPISHSLAQSLNSLPRAITLKK